MSRHFLARCLSFAVAVAVWPTTAHAIDPGVAPAPFARKVPKELSLHGDTRLDDYFWLREKSDPSVIAHLNAENAYTDAVTKPLEPFQQTLYREMLGRIKQTDLEVPYREGGFFYYSRTEQGKQYAISCRKPGSLGAPEQVILDCNELARGEKFFDLWTSAVSPDGNSLAYLTDVTGYREYTLRIKDLKTGAVLGDAIPKVDQVAWASDNKTVFYSTEDAAKRPYRVYRHVIGSDFKTDPIVFEEKDELFRVSVRRSKDRKYLFLNSSSSTTDEQSLIPADRPEAAPKVIVPREEGHEYSVEHRDGTFYILTNKGEGNREFRLVTAPADDPSPAHWKELIAARPKTFLQNIALFKDYGVLSGVDSGLPFLEILDLGAGTSHRVQFPEPAYSVFGAANPEYDTSIFRYRYQSMVTPLSVYDFDMAARKATLLKRTEVLGGYNPDDYRSERIFAPATDGTPIPIALVSKKTTPRDGSAPLLLYGYGSYGAPTPVTFSSPNLSLLDRGMIFAIAQIRGGGDLGKGWHDDGKMMKKRNTFTDFIACADHLIARNYTRANRLAIRGGSAGGLLIGAVCNLRPDLCKVAILEVPFVDVLSTMSDPSLPLTVQEYLEWGNPNVKAEYDTMKSYSPYDNIAPTAYPTMLVRTSLNDSQVPYWEPAKYVAKMRAVRLDKNPLLLKVNMDAGHGGASGRYDALKETAFLDAFLLDQLGIHP